MKKQPFLYGCFVFLLKMNFVFCDLMFLEYLNFSEPKYIKVLPQFQEDGCILQAFRYLLERLFL
jgi:hypothetical protein